MKAYQPRPAGRHVRSTPTGKLTRDGDFTNHDATAEPPAAEQEDKTPAAETGATPPKKGK